MASSSLVEVEVLVAMFQYASSRGDGGSPPTGAQDARMARVTPDVVVARISLLASRRVVGRPAGRSDAGAEGLKR